MAQPARTTAGHQTNDHGWSSEFDEDTLYQYLVQNTHNAVQSWVEHRVGSLTTSARESDLDSVDLTSFDDSGQGGDQISPIVDLPLPHVPPSAQVTFHALQEWEGFVTAINEDEFTAQLSDLTSGASHAREEADIPLDEISEDDAEKMRVGSIFRWVIGYERAGRSKKRVSNIVFRDLPMITETDMRGGKQWANKIATAFEE